MSGQVFKKTSVACWAGVFFFFALIGLDQLAKHFAAATFRNYQFAFSLPLPAWLIYFIYAAIIFALAAYLKKHYRLLALKEAVGWLLLAAGAMENVIERVVLGYVRDFIFITWSRWTGIYNLADLYIVLGIIILIIASAPERQLKKYF